MINPPYSELLVAGVSALLPLERMTRSVGFLEGNAVFLSILSELKAAISVLQIMCHILIFLLDNNVILGARLLAITLGNTERFVLSHSKGLGLLVVSQPGAVISPVERFHHQVNLIRLLANALFKSEGVHWSFWHLEHEVLSCSLLQIQLLSVGSGLVLLASSLIELDLSNAVSEL